MSGVMVGVGIWLGGNVVLAGFLMLRFRRDLRWTR